jgi:hypothetical protein
MSFDPGLSVGDIITKEHSQKCLVYETWAAWVIHKTHGMGTVKEFDGTIIRIGFDNGKEADYIYDKAIQTQSLALID